MRWFGDREPCLVQNMMIDSVRLVCIDDAVDDDLIVSFIYVAKRFLPLLVDLLPVV